MNHWADPRVATNALSFDMIYHVPPANVLINLQVKQPVTNFATRDSAFSVPAAVHFVFTQNK